jgi:hypothetical protein
VRDVNGRIIDIKTAKRKPPSISASHQLQIGTYAMLHPEASGEAQLVTLTKTKTVAMHTDTMRVQAHDRQLTTRLYSIARDQMQAGLYAPNRASFLCSRKYCGYWMQCQEEFGGVVSGEAGE